MKRPNKKGSKKPPQGDIVQNRPRFNEEPDVDVDNSIEMLPEEKSYGGNESTQSTTDTRNPYNLTQTNDDQPLIVVSFLSVRLAFIRDSHESNYDSHYKIVYTNGEEYRDDMCVDVGGLHEAESDSEDESTQSEYSNDENHVCDICSEKESNSKNETTQKELSKKKDYICYTLTDEESNSENESLQKESSKNQGYVCYTLSDEEMDIEYENTKNEPSDDEDHICDISSKKKSNSEYQTTQRKPSEVKGRDIHTLPEEESNIEYETTQREPRVHADSDIGIVSVEESRGGKESTQFPINLEDQNDLTQTKDAEQLKIPGLSSNQLVVGRDSNGGNNKSHFKIMDTIDCKITENSNQSFKVGHSMMNQNAFEYINDGASNDSVLHEEDSNIEYETTQKEHSGDVESDIEIVLVGESHGGNVSTQFSINLEDPYDSIQTSDDEHLIIPGTSSNQLAVGRDSHEDKNKSHFKTMDTIDCEIIEISNEFFKVDDSVMIQNASEYINDGGSDGTVLPEEEPNIVYETTQREPSGDVNRDIEIVLVGESHGGRESTQFPINLENPYDSIQTSDDEHLIIPGPSSNQSAVGRDSHEGKSKSHFKTMNTIDFEINDINNQSFKVFDSVMIQKAFEHINDGASNDSVVHAEESNIENETTHREPSEDEDIDIEIVPAEELNGGNESTQFPINFEELYDLIQANEDEHLIIPGPSSNQLAVGRDSHEGKNKSRFKTMDTIDCKIIQNSNRSVKVFDSVMIQKAFEHINDGASNSSILSEEESNIENETTQWELSEVEDSDIEIVPAEELNEGYESTQFPINFEELYDLTRANDYEHLIISGPSSNQLAVRRDSHEGKNKSHFKTMDTIGCKIIENSNQSVKVFDSVIIQKAFEHINDGTSNSSILSEAESNIENETTQREPSEDEDSDIEIVPAEELNGGNESTQFPINFEELYDLIQANEDEHLIIPGPSSNQLAVRRDSHEGKNKLRFKTMDTIDCKIIENSNRSVKVFDSVMIQKAFEHINDGASNSSILSEEESNIENETTQREPSEDEDSDIEIVPAEELNEENESIQFPINFEELYDLTRANDYEHLIIPGPSSNQLAVRRDSHEGKNKSHFKTMDTIGCKIIQNSNRSVKVFDSVMIQKAFEHINDGASNSSILSEEESNIENETIQREPSEDEDSDIEIVPAEELNEGNESTQFPINFEELYDLTRANDYEHLIIPGPSSNQLTVGRDSHEGKNKSHFKTMDTIDCKIIENSNRSVKVFDSVMIQKAFEHINDSASNSSILSEEESNIENETTQREPNKDEDSDLEIVPTEELNRGNESVKFPINLHDLFDLLEDDDNVDLAILGQSSIEMAVAMVPSTRDNKSHYKIMDIIDGEINENSNQSFKVGDSVMIQKAFEYINDGGSNSSILSEEDSNIENETTQREPSEDEDSDIEIVPAEELNEGNELTQFPINFEELYDLIQANEDEHLIIPGPSSNQLAVGRDSHEGKNKSHFKTMDTIDCKIIQNSNRSVKVFDSVMIQKAFEHINDGASNSSILSEEESNIENETTQREPSDDEDSDIEIVPAEELNEGNESTQFPINFEELYDLTRANDYDHLIIPGPSSNQLAVGRDSHEGKIIQNSNRSVKVFDSVMIQKAFEHINDGASNSSILSEEESNIENETTQREPSDDEDSDTEIVPAEKLNEGNESTQFPINFEELYDLTRANDYEHLIIPGPSSNQLAVGRDSHEGKNKSHFKTMDTIGCEIIENNDQSFKLGDSVMIQNEFEYINDVGSNSLVTNEVVEFCTSTEYNGEVLTEPNELVQNYNQSDKDIYIRKTNRKRKRTLDSVSFNSRKKSRLDNPE